jgi:phage shock protein PspC (stress-responsive transcriptional regulator)
MKLNITLDGRRFYRSNSDAWLFGICGGLARHFSWNPMLVRGVVAILAIAVPGISTIGMILAYIVLGLLIPSEDQA